MQKIYNIMGLCILLLAACAPAFAQANATANLEGTITDKNQAVVAGATVTVTSKSTGLARTATTNESGNYRIEQLPAGFYDIKISAKGFTTASADNYELLVGRTSTLDISLTPGLQTETVNVTGEVPIVDVQKTDVSLNITPREVQDLPLNGRDFANLAFLAPGAKPVDSYDPTKNRIAVFGINGSSGRNVNVTVNGIDNKDNTVGGPVMQLPLEAVQEFRISTQRFSAANGRSEGAAVNVVTKSGSNQFHGGGYVFERDQKFNAKEKNPDGTTKPNKAPFSRQQYGGSIGGPIVKDKAFFFFALEKQREITSFTVDTDALAQLQLVTSLGAQPSPIIPTPYRDTRYNARVDYRFNEKHNAFASYSSQSNRGLNDQATSRTDLTGGNFTTNQLQIANVTLNSILTPKVVNAATVGFQYWNNLIDSDKKVPTFVFGSGGSAITFGTNTNVPQQSYQRKFQFKDDLSITHGNHTFQTGVDYVYEPQLGGFFEFNPTLEIDFAALPSIILNDKTTYPNGFASPGAVVGMSATAGDPYFNLPGGAKMFGVYFQDEWKARHNLTLSLGVRYDKDINLIGSAIQAKNRTYLALKAINSPYAARLPKDDDRGISPRVGFAYDLKGDGKHVVRGGYGLYFGQTFLNIPLFMIQQTNATIFAGVFALGSSDIVPGTTKTVSQFRFGIDPLPAIPAASSQLQAGNTGRLIDPDYRNPYTQQWNIGYSYQLNQNSVIEIEYTHVLGLHESKTININPTRFDPNNVNATLPRPLSAAFAAAGQPVLGRIDDEQSIGRSRYDGLNISYRRRLSNHFSVNTNYVLSRALAYNGNSAAFRNRPTDYDNIFGKQDLGPTPNDERHRFVFSGIFDLPWGLQFAPIMQLASARPYTASEGTIDVFGWGSGRGTAHAFVPISDPNNVTFYNSIPVANNQLRNTLRACLVAKTCYETGFDTLRGQAFFQLDTRVSKRIRFKEKYELSLLFQAFDLTNRANFGNKFDGNVLSPTFRQATGSFIATSGVIIPHSFSAEFGAQFRF